MEEIKYFKKLEEYLISKDKKPHERQKYIELTLDFPDYKRKDVFYNMINYFIDSYKETYLEKFIDYIEDPFFKEYRKDICYNISYKKVYPIIINLINNNKNSLAEKYINLFIQEKDRNLSHISNIDKILQSNPTTQVLNFLIKNFNGWENPNIINTLLSSSNTNLQIIEMITQKTGPLKTSIYFNALKNYFYKNDNNIVVSQVINKHISIDKYHPTVQRFIIYNLKNKHLSLKHFSDKEDSFLNKINDEAYLTEWFLKDNDYFNEQIPYIKELILQKYIDPNKIVNTILKNTFTFSKLPNKKLNLYQRLIVELYQNNFIAKENLVENPHLYQYIVNFFNNDIFNWKNSGLLKKEIFNLPLDFNFSFDYQQKTTTLNEYFQETQNICYIFYCLDKKINHFNSQKNNLDLVLKEADGLVKDQFHYFLTPGIINDLYKHSFINKTEQQFFCSWFIENPLNETTLKHVIQEEFFDIFKKSSHTLLFNLEEYNPYLKYLEVNKSITNTDFFKKIITFFNGATIYDPCNKNKENVLDIAKHYMNNFIYKELTYYVLTKFPKQTNKNKAYSHKKAIFNNFFSIFKKTENSYLPTPIQLYKDVNGIKVILHRSDIIQLQDTNQGITKSNHINKRTSNSYDTFEDLINDAYSNIEKLNILLEQYHETDINIEFKIRSEKLLLNNVNFLTQTKKTGLNLNFEDTLFIKNNIGKYLFKCIEVYGNSLKKYEYDKSSFFKNNAHNSQVMIEKIHTEALKQITLLEKELELVQQHITNQLEHDVLSDMKINTRILEGRIKHSNYYDEKIIHKNKHLPKQNSEEMELENEAKVVQIKPKKVI